MENTKRPAADETFPQVLAAIKDANKLTETKLAERLGLHVSTVNNWAHGKAQPRPAAVKALADQFPAFRDRILAATGRKAPGPMSPDREAELIKDFRELTAEQQRTTMILAKALRDSNQSA